MTLFCLLWELPFIAKKQFLFYSFPISGSKPVLEVCLTNPYEASQFKTATTLLNFEGNGHCQWFAIPPHLPISVCLKLLFILFCQSKNVQRKFFIFSCVVWFGAFLAISFMISPASAVNRTSTYTSRYRNWVYTFSS